MKTKRSKKIPFDFVIEELHSLRPVVKPMFGCHAIYVGPKIVLILREKEDYTRDNGVWLATTAEHHESLRKDFPVMRSLELFDSDKPTGWQNIPSSDPKFESLVIKACEFILRRDPRIGKVPAKKKSPRKRVK